MKKLTLAITLAVLLSACGKEESTPSPAKAQTPPSSMSAVEFNNAVQQSFQKNKQKKAPPLDTSTKTYKKSDLYPSE